MLYLCAVNTRQDTICAISTPYGVGGIAVVRVSGKEAIAKVASLLGRSLQELKSCFAERSASSKRPFTTFAKIADLDDVIVTFYFSPHSFTGEDVVEISCHGSLYVQQELIRRLIAAGCRLARAGEFTERAFLNGKMDLSQAEAVADLIAAETKAEKDLALSQLRGGLSSELSQLREQLLHFTSLVELELDFADHEELEFADRGDLRTLSVAITHHLERLTESFRTGNAIKNGIPVAIVGPANAGKSTLLNALVGEDRAIVSDIAGTTRDTIEERLIIDGILFRLIDTAGLRESSDTIEQLGIERSRRAIEQAAIVIYLEDINNPTPTTLKGDNIIHVYNKVDQALPIDGECCISAKEGKIEPLIDKLKAAAAIFKSEGVMLSNARHYEALTRALEAIRRVQAGLDQGLSGELLSMDLEDCLNALGEVTGQITSQEVLNNIFSKFCIGK